MRVSNTPKDVQNFHSKNETYECSPGIQPCLLPVVPWNLYSIFFFSFAIPLAIPHYIISASSLQQSGQTLAQFVM